MDKLGTTEILILVGIPVLIFLFIFWIGRMSGKNSAYKEFLKKERDKNRP